MRKLANMPAITSRNLTLRYTLALGLIALLSISAYLSLYKVIKTQEKNATVINISGRQRMLSQSTSLFALRFAISVSDDERERWRIILREKADLMEKSHDGLTKGSEEMNLPFTLSPTVRAMYFDPPMNLDIQVRDHLAKINALLRTDVSELSKDNPYLKYILFIASNKLLPSLDAMVHQYETESRESVLKLYSMERYVLGLTLLVLIMEAIFIFRPAVREIRKYTTQLLASEKQVAETLQAVLDTVGEGIVTVDDNNVIVRVNDEALDMWGYSSAELVGSNINKLIPSISIKTGDLGERIELNGIKKNGTVFPIEVKTKETEATDKVLFTAAVHDITERKQTAAALLESKEILERIFETTHFSIVLLDSKFNFIRVNKAYAATCQCEPDFFPGKNHFNLYPSKELESKFRLVVETGEPYTAYSRPFKFPDQPGRGTTYWDLAIRPIAKVSGEVEGILFTLLEVTKRKQAEEELNRLGTAINQAAELIVITDSAGSIQFVNPAFEKITGYSRDEAIGLNPRILKSGKHDEAFYRNLWETITKGDTWRGHFTNKKKNGELFEEEATITPVLSPDGEIINYIAVKRDVTREASLERQAKRSQKMESIGTLAGGIAHDFNNMLTPIIGFIEIVINDLPNRSEKRNDLQEALNASLRAKELVKQILTFSARKEQELVPTHLHAIIKQSLKLVRASLPSTVEMFSDIDESSGVVMADHTQIDQLAMNLCANSGYAMKEKGGLLSVILIPVEVDEEWASSHIGLNAGPYAMLSVTDTGIGMSEETMDRIFDPFFTTKPEGEGTGMGLATAHGIVKAHKGVITVESQPGQGAAINVFFPRIETGASQENESDLSIPKGDERILLVDDEEVLAKMGKKILERIGYQVKAVTRSSKALEIFQDSPYEFDLLLTDQTMPGTEGAALATEIKKIRPEIPVIICTGFNKSISPEMARKIGIEQFVMKPYTIQTLARAIRSALDSNG